MELIRLELNNFQGVKKAEFGFGGRSASVYGDNGTGKTTLYNAFTWLLFDKDSLGTKNYTPKTKTQQGDAHHLEHSVEGMFQKEDGTIVSLKKTLKELWRKKKGALRDEFDGHTVEYAVNGVPTKQAEYQKTVSDMCGFDAEKPKMLTMPDYFPQRMDWKARRYILLDMCGEVSDDEIINANPELHELKEFLKMPGTSDRFYSTDDYRKITSARRSEINKKLAEIPGRIDENERAKLETGGLSQKELEESENFTSNVLNALEASRAAIVGDGMFETAEKEFNQRITDVERDYTDKQRKRNADADAKRFEMQKKVNVIEDDVERAERTLEMLESELASTKIARQCILAEYAKVEAETFDETSTVCPVCKREFDADKIAGMRANFNLDKSKRLEAISLRGKTEASKERIAEIEDKIEGAKKAIEAQKTIAESIYAELSKIPRPDFTPFTASEEYQQLLADKPVRRQVTCVEIDADIEKNKAELAEIRAKLGALKANEAISQRIEELETQERSLAAERENLEKGLYLCDMFTKAKVSSLTEHINEHFKNVRFRLFKEQINGGIADDCEVLIPGKDGALVPYSFANNASRINAGLEIIDSLSAFWNLRLPIWVDNAESVTKLAEIGSQVIRLVVSENDKTLRMEVE